MKKKYLVIGNPIEHSLSPELHNYWIKSNNLDAIYEKKKLEVSELENLVSNIKEMKLNGANVTVPFKKKIIPYLDQLSIEAKKTQSVNTIYLEENKVIGHNTDIDGFELGIKKTNFDFKNKKVFILGAGGVVSSIIYALNKMKVSNILISNRTKAKAEELKILFKNLTILDWGEIPKFDIIINATSVGLNQNDQLKIDLSKAGNNKFFYDIIYNPKETNFLRIGKKLGNEIENGKMMFIYQALAAFKIWHGFQPNITRDVINILEND
jgi:shikimate dehydrogenase